jgi:HPt (histidine-containing phosphotransfer) domain-containing protein
MSEPVAPMYNMGKILEMSRGNNDFVKKMVELTISESSNSKQKIVEAYEAGDFDTVKYYAHRLKPSIISLEINDLRNEVVQIEALALNGQKTPELQGMIEKLDHVLGMVIDNLKTEYNA